MLKQLFALTKTDFRSRYAGNFFGTLWAFVYPAVTVLLYWLVFRVILKTGPVDGSSYIIWLVSALVPYLFISDSLAASAGALLDYSYIARKSRLNIGLLPGARVLSCLFIHGVYLLLVFALKRSFALNDLRLIFYIAAELAFSLSIGYILAVLTVFLRDIRSIILVLTQIGFWVTPIFWSDAPEPFATLLRIVNPAAFVAEGFRSTLCGTAPPPLWYFVYFFSFVAVITIFSKCLFRCTKQRIVDFF